MDSHCHDDVIQFLINFLKNFVLVARYRAVVIVTRVTRAPRSKHSKNLGSTWNMPIFGKQLVHLHPEPAEIDVVAVN
jgi:hypothetical protein